MEINMKNYFNEQLVTYFDFYIFVKEFYIFNNSNIIYIFVIIFCLVMILFSGKAGKIIRDIGKYGTGGLAILGGVDSTLNLIDRIRDNLKDGSGSSSESNDKNDDNKDELKKENKNDNKDELKKEDNKNETNKQ